MDKELKTIQSVQRAIDIINCIADAGKKISLKEISEELDLNVNTARGLVQTLLSNGFLARDLEQGTYSLGYEFYTKSTQLYEFQLKNIREAAYPDMQRLADMFSATTCLQISFYSDIYTLETAAPPASPYAYIPNSATDLPLHASASGKLLLAYSPEAEQQKLFDKCSLEPFTENTITDRTDLIKIIKQVNTQGYAIEMDEMSLGIGCIAAPIFDIRGTLRATLSIVAASPVLKPVLKKAIVELKRSGERISNEISYRKNRNR